MEGYKFDGFAGERLDMAITQLFGVDKELSLQWIQSGKVSINSKEIVKGNYKLKKGDNIQIDTRNAIVRNIMAQKKKKLAEVSPRAKLTAQDQWYAHLGEGVYSEKQVKQLLASWRSGKKFNPVADYDPLVWIKWLDYYKGKKDENAVRIMRKMIWIQTRRVVANLRYKNSFESESVHTNNDHNNNNLTSVAKNEDESLSVVGEGEVDEQFSASYEDEPPILRESDEFNEEEDQNNSEPEKKVLREIQDKNSEIISFDDDLSELAWDYPGKNEPPPFTTSSNAAELKQPILDLQLEVLQEDVLNVALKLKKEGYNPLVLNMTGPSAPGGAVHIGNSGYESSIFRRSDYHTFLYPLQELYRLPDFTAIFTSGVSILRQNEEQGYAWESDLTSLKLDFLAMNAYGRPKLVHQKKQGGVDVTDRMKDRTKMKMKAILSVVVDKGYDSVVLGAFGCGQLRNPPWVIAQLWKEVLLEFYSYHEFRLLHPEMYEQEEEEFEEERKDEEDVKEKKTVQVEESGVCYRRGWEQF